MGEAVDAVVVGAGVIGLAVARALALAGREVIVLEAEAAIGTHTSARNSEVIHAGLYYPTGSRKARLCVEGRALLYDYCAARGVPHARTGKLLVATDEAELPALEKLRVQALANGVTDLVPLDAAEVHALEPEVRAVRGMLSPSTGIVDSHAMMAALRADAIEHGAGVALRSPLVRARVDDAGLTVETGGDEPATLTCRTLVNAAGLRAQDVSRSIAGLRADTIPGQHFAIGHYFTLRGRHPFRRLVYPMPVPGGLGIHLTLDLGGQARFGPDVSWRSGVDYAFDEERGAAFYPSIRRYWPGLPDGALQPGYTGIRPKLSPAGSPADDFVVQGPAVHGVPGLVCLYGIESPGLTAALAIAGEVEALLRDGRAG